MKSKCRECGGEINPASDFIESTGFCSTPCLDAFRLQEIRKICEKYGVTVQSYNNVQEEVNRLPDYHGR